MFHVKLVSLTIYRMEFDNPERPECNNLLSIYQLVTGKTKEVLLSHSVCLMDKSLSQSNFLRGLCTNRLPLFYHYQEVENECQNMNWGTFKAILTDAVVDHLHPIQVNVNIIYYLFLSSPVLTNLFL